MYSLRFLAGKKKELAESTLPFYEILTMGLLLPFTLPFIYQTYFLA